MFKRMIFDETVAIFLIASFVTALSIMASIAWGALRMRRSQTDRMSQLPFND
ncbi:hypothetical protein [Nibricoccus sp. IMCC34717]|uniref:hypothetical protein n=1 Tax=Nibricoccus sp. IMCC34717 TaxID=3034021 RepID=UPI00384B4E0F